jgi:hypothetical protein
MSKLYVANATTQNQAFSYRVPDEHPTGGLVYSKNRTQEIPPGRQIAISGDLSSAQIDAIIEQHRKYGLLKVDEIGRQSTHIHIVASVDRPISASRLEEVMKNNLVILKERGKQMRKLAAIQTHEETAGNMNDPDAPTLVKMELEVEELRERFSNVVEAPLEEHIRVSNTLSPGQSPTPPRAKGSRSKKAA